jgi:hypothetical protein
LATKAELLDERLRAAESWLAVVRGRLAACESLLERLARAA